MKINIKELAVFGMLGALMYASKILMDLFPNIHIIGVFIVAMTVVYRFKALYPLTVFISITGFLSGFATWWLPYIYIWLPLWGVTMLLPKNMSKAVEAPVYMSVCALHGFLYGTLYAPAQAILFGLDFKGMISWIIAGLPFDFIHGISNFFCGALILPMVLVFRATYKYLK